MTDFAKETLQYHNVLNPVAWHGMSLKPDVCKALLTIGQKFVETWGFDIPVKDIILTGSNANYNWTIFSDFDVHVVADMDSVPSASKDFVESYLKARKNLWNQSKKITVKGYPVEVYAQDDDEILIANGVYSLMTNTWLKEPKKVEPNIDHLAVREKVDDLTHQIEQALEGGLQEAPMEILKKLAHMRKSALQTAGEFSVENLAFKVLRNNGMIEKLRNALEEYTTRNLTLESTDLVFGRHLTLDELRAAGIKTNKWKKRVVDDQTEAVEPVDEELRKAPLLAVKMTRKSDGSKILIHHNTKQREHPARLTQLAGPRTRSFFGSYQKHEPMGHEDVRPRKEEHPVATAIKRAKELGFRKPRFIRHGDNLKRESVEPIVELSHETTKSYEKKALSAIKAHWQAHDKATPRSKEYWDHVDKVAKRSNGLRNVGKRSRMEKGETLAKASQRGSLWSEAHDFKVGEVVVAKVGVHKGQPHKVIHVDGDRINVKPIGMKNKYHLGAAQAHPSELVREGVELTELSKEKLKAYRSEAKLGSVPPPEALKRYEYTADDYGEKAKKRSRGVILATKKIIQKHKEEAARARAARQARSPEKEAEAHARRAKWVAANPEKAAKFGVKVSEEAGVVDEALSGAQGRDPLMKKQLSPHLSPLRRMAADTRREMNRTLLAKLTQKKESKEKERPVSEDAEPIQEAGLTVYGRWKKARVAKIWGWKRNKFKKKALAQSASNKTIDRRSGLSARHSLYKRVLRGGSKKKLAYSARKSVEGVVKRQHTAFITVPGTRSRWKARGRDDRRVSGTGQTKV